MDVSFNNISLFIKRAEEYQGKDFIINTFAFLEIGTVSDVTFIKKQNERGTYNGAIVVFKQWNYNQLVKQIFDEMNNSDDGTTKLFFNSKQYWIINIHKQLTNKELKIGRAHV